MLIVAFSRCLATLLPLLMRAKTCFPLSLSLPPSIFYLCTIVANFTCCDVTSAAYQLRCRIVYACMCACVGVQSSGKVWLQCACMFVCLDLCCASLWLFLIACSLSLTTRHPVGMTPYLRSQCEQTVCLSCTQNTTVNNTHINTHVCQPCSAYTPRTFIGCEVWQR